MDILIAMCVGILAGRFFISGRVKRANERLSLLCTFVLILQWAASWDSRRIFLKSFWLWEDTVSSFLPFLPFFPSVLCIFLQDVLWTEKET